MPIAVRRLLPILFATLLLAATTPGVAAYSSRFPTQSLGNRGADVRAIQGLLTARGFPVPIDGIFAATTEDRVKAFQASRGLAADGVVRDATWAKLIPTMGTGYTGQAVKVLQRQLNEKRFAHLVVDGLYTTATRSAVITFQRHMGMAPPYGTVGPLTWRNLLWHYDYPAFTATSLCDYSDGNGRANWGTGAAIGQLEAAAKAFFKTGHGRVAVGDLSWEHGGNIPGHATHEVGLDADLRLIRFYRNQCTVGTTWRTPYYDRSATRMLINAIRAAAPGHVKLVYFNDPVLIHEGLTTWYAGHDDHLHVRYCERSYPNTMYRC
jgi:peptidoglycan hydrolase-like protein with peptidoglycan-binding domain